MPYPTFRPWLAFEIDKTTAPHLVAYREPDLPAAICNGCECYRSIILISYQTAKFECRERASSNTLVRLMFLESQLPLHLNFPPISQSYE